MYFYVKSTKHGNIKYKYQPNYNAVSVTDESASVLYFNSETENIIKNALSRHVFNVI